MARVTAIPPAEPPTIAIRPARAWSARISVSQQAIRSRRRHAPIVSPTLLALPESVRPTSVLACTTCPAGSWYHDEERLACHCAARRYVSWLPEQKPIALCDDREAALAEQDAG